MHISFAYPPCISCSGYVGSARAYGFRWPQLLGKNQTEAIKVIKQENPYVTVLVLQKGYYTIMNYCCNRVNLWVDKGIVIQVPQEPYKCNARYSSNPTTIRMSGWKPYPPCMDGGCMDPQCCVEGPNTEFKYEWPELVGKPQEEAAEVIKRENPYVAVVPIQIGNYTIMNFCCNRVWLWVDKGVVYSKPTIG